MKMAKDRVRKADGDVDFAKKVTKNNIELALEESNEHRALEEVETFGYLELLQEDKSI